MRSSARLLSFCFATSVVMLGACAPKPETPKPVNKTLSVEAGPNINRYNDTANPVVVRIYQLSARTEFEAASFWQVFNNDSPDLAGVVLDKRSLSPLYPGETRLVAFDLVPDVFYLGAFGEFADFDTQQFRSVVPIDKERLDNGVTISVTSSGLSIQFRNPEDAKDDDEKDKKKKGGLGQLFKKLFEKASGGGE